MITSVFSLKMKSMNAEVQKKRAVLEKKRATMVARLTASSEKEREATVKAHHAQTEVKVNTELTFRKREFASQCRSKEAAHKTQITITRAKFDTETADLKYSHQAEMKTLQNCLY